MSLTLAFRATRGSCHYCGGGGTKYNGKKCEVCGGTGRCGG